MDTLYLTNYDTCPNIIDFAIKCLAYVELLVELRYLALDLRDCMILLKMEYLSNFPKLQDIFGITIGITTDQKAKAITRRDSTISSWRRRRRKSTQRDYARP